MCEWFVLCTNRASTTRPHPILGDVPICERCNALAEYADGNGVGTDDSYGDVQRSW